MCLGIVLPMDIARPFGLLLIITWHALIIVSLRLFVMARWVPGVFLFDMAASGFALDMVLHFYWCSQEF